MVAEARDVNANDNDLTSLENCEALGELYGEAINGYFDNIVGEWEVDVGVPPIGVGRGSSGVAVMAAAVNSGFWALTLPFVLMEQRQTRGSITAWSA